MNDNKREDFGWSMLKVLMEVAFGGKDLCDLCPEREGCPRDKERCPYFDRAAITG